MTTKEIDDVLLIAKFMGIKIMPNTNDVYVTEDGHVSLYQPYLCYNQLMKVVDKIEKSGYISTIEKMRYSEHRVWFNDLSPIIVEEIIDDILEHKQFKQDCIKFISNLEVITVDIVKAVIQEVNIHCEAPENFGDVFNVKKLTGKFNIEVEDSDGNFIPFIKNATLNNRPMYAESSIGMNLGINDEYLGTITDVIDRSITI